MKIGIINFNNTQKDHNGNSRPPIQSSKKRSYWFLVYTLWIVFIILSQVPLLANTLIDYSAMDETVESHLKFPEDGKVGHYYVERYDTNQTGYINVVYTTETNSLKVDCTNIRVLRIYCREMYEKKSEEVFKFDPGLDSNYYKTYFIERDYFHVHVYTKLMIEELAFIDTPIPYNVSVNGNEWWLTEINYTYNDDGIVLTKVPPGHNNVDIYFKSNSNKAPVAKFTASKTLIGVGETVIFNASQSYDLDGEIISYVWDLSDGTFKIGEEITHTFLSEGVFNIILTVKDDDYLIGNAYKKITVVSRIMSVSKMVDKPIATPGSILEYTITADLNSSWKDGVSDIVVKDTLPDELEYVESTPVPQIKGKTVIWNIGKIYKEQDFPTIILKAKIDLNVENETYIYNYAILEYQTTSGVPFPQELTNLVETKVNVGSILAPRIKVPVPDVILQEDDPPYNLYLTPYEYDLQDNGTDLKWYITGENESLYVLSGEYSDNDVLNIIPIPDAFGNDLVTLWLADSDGYMDSQQLWINITPVNDPPIFSDAPDLIVHYDDPYTFDYEPYLYDIDTQKEKLQLLYTEKSNEFESFRGIDKYDGGRATYDEISIEGFNVTYTFPEDDVGTQVFISLVVFDGEDGYDEDLIIINVTDDYTPNLIDKLPDVLLHEGETKYNVFDLDDYFDDPDGDSLFYSFGESHVKITINKDHTVDISSTSDWYGLEIVTFRARDPVGALAEDSIFVTVNPINDPPVISGLPEKFVVRYEIDYSFDLTPYVSDKDNEINELFLMISDKNIRTDPINQLKIIMNYPESMLGMEVPVKLVVSDGIDNAKADIIIKVTENWPPEITMQIPDITFYEDESLKNHFNLNDYFLDKDSQTLYYSYGQENVNIVIFQDGTVDFTATKDWHGIELVTFRATDSTFAFVENVVTVTVIPVNDPPEIDKLPMQKGFINELFKFDLSEFINDVDNNISELILTIDSEKLDIMISGWELMIYSDEPLLEEVKITISDGQAETSETLFIEIQEEKLKPSDVFEISPLFLWILILLILAIITIFGYAAYRRYYGNYAIEEIFWIYNDGILLHHLSAKKRKHRRDKEILSSMLLGIMDFAQDAFTEEEEKTKDWSIKEIQMNEKNILVDRGKYSFLATVFSGRSGKKLYILSGRTLNLIERKYKRILKSWDGKVSELHNAKKSIKYMLISNSKNGYKKEADGLK